MSLITRKLCSQNVMCRGILLKYKTMLLITSTEGWWRDAWQCEEATDFVCIVLGGGVYGKVIMHAIDDIFALLSRSPQVHQWTTIMTPEV